MWHTLTKFPILLVKCKKHIKPVQFMGTKKFHVYYFLDENYKMMDGTKSMYKKMDVQEFHVLLEWWSKLHELLYEMLYLVRNFEVITNVIHLMLELIDVICGILAPIAMEQPLAYMDMANSVHALNGITM